MDLNPLYKLAEDAIETLGIDPATTRCEGDGQWLINRDEVEIYIDIWQPEGHNQWEYFKEDEPTAIYQVVAPVCDIPKEPEIRRAFLEEILYINHHMFYGSFTINLEQNMAAIRFKRITDGLNRVEMIEPIESIGYYAENFIKFLGNKYGVSPAVKK